MEKAGTEAEVEKSQEVEKSSTQAKQKYCSWKFNLSADGGQNTRILVYILMEGKSWVH